MSNLSYTDLEKYFSTQRLQRYSMACSGDKARAIELYKANIRISQSFHPLLCLFELILRNQLNLKLSTFFNDADWILNQRAIFMSHTSLAIGRFYLRTQIENTIRKLTNGRYTPISGKVIADLSFGFWTALFLSHHFTLLRGRPIQIFTRLPSYLGRNDVHTNLNLIRDFRNRISHSEPICFNVNTISFSNAIQTYKAIRKTIRWIDPQLLSFTKEFDSVIEEIKKANKI